MLRRVPTLTVPVVAPNGTLALISDGETTSNLAGVPLKVTKVASVRWFPKIVTDVRNLPEVGRVSTKGRSPTFRLKTVPQPPEQLLLVPPRVVVP
jgi:hypothetical protein